jgi:HlyD family secretion protein
VLSTHAVKIASGSKVIIDRWGGEQPLEGRVRVVEPSGFTKVSALGVEEQRVRVIVDISSPRELWARLADGFRVEARFVLWEGDKVLQVPTSALFRQGEGWAVFTLAGDRARLAPVQIGQRAGRATEVKSGLNEGDRVLAHPDEKIGDGARVKARQ